MGDGGGDIIIRGGSVDLQFDDSLYPKDPNDPKSHKNGNKKITRVVITGDISFDSGDHPEGLRCDVKAITK